LLIRLYCGYKFGVTWYRHNCTFQGADEEGNDKWELEKLKGIEWFATAPKFRTLKTSVLYVPESPGFEFVDAFWKDNSPNIRFIQLSVSAAHPKTYELFTSLCDKLGIALDGKVQMIFHYVTVSENQARMFSADGSTKLSTFWSAVKAKKRKNLQKRKSQRQRPF